MKPESEKSISPGCQVSAKGSLRTSISLILSNMALDWEEPIVAPQRGRVFDMQVALNLRCRRSRSHFSRLTAFPASCTCTLQVVVVLE